MTKQSETSGRARAQILRRERARRLALRFALWVLVPTALATCYYALWAADQYDSVAVFTVRSNEAGGAGMQALATAEPTAASKQDLALTIELIESRAMFDRLKKEGFAAHYAGSGDVFSQLSEGAGSEEGYEYYREKIAVSQPSKAGSLTLRVRAFTPEAAQSFSRSILGHAEEMLNALAAEGRAERVATVEALAKAAGERAKRARAVIRELESQGITAGNDTYAEALVERELAEQAYETAVESVALARLESELEPRNLVVVSGPSLSDESTHPRRLWSIATVFFVALSLMGVLSLLAGAVREHANF